MLSLQVQVALGFCLVYVCMQTFAVPGTLSLSLLSGALYGTLPGLLLVSGQTLLFSNKATTMTMIGMRKVLAFFLCFLVVLNQAASS